LSNENLATGEPLYHQVADRIARLIVGGTYRAGHRVPSVRRLSGQYRVSVSTVLEAYRLLEDRGVLEARPQSGYYVRSQERPPEPLKTTSCSEATELDVSTMVLNVLRESNRKELVPFGAAVPSPSFLPTSRLNRILAQEVRRDPNTSQSYDAVPGLPSLRIQIARRALEAGVTLTPDEIITTSGAQEAVQLCLRAVTRPGDTVAVESPTYFGLLEALESLHVKALEIATDPRTGICLDDLEEALDKEGIAAVVLVPSFGNPLGHCMPVDRRKRLAEMLRRFQVPLIEDDVYGELAFTPRRPPAVKAFDTSGDVLLCSSFSKTLAPGYRIGWAAPGRHFRRVELLKYSASVSTATPTQMAVAAFLAGGGFDRYLRRLRRTYRDLMQRLAAAIGDHFPEGTRVSRPEGGHVLWVELPSGADSLKLHAAALRHGISIAPGPLFSATGRYRNFMRLNGAVPWSERVEDAVVTLGRLVREQLGARES